MTIVVHCDACGEELQDVGGILLGPPDRIGAVKKQHLCRTCYEHIDTVVHMSKVGADAQRDLMEHFAATPDWPLPGTMFVRDFED